MNKKKLSERDICSKFITPAITKSGWDLLSQVREEVSFTKGRIIVRGKLHTRGEQKRADYVLYYKANIPLAVIEAKDNSHAVGSGMQQALDYADCLSTPFVFSSNGDGFLMHDLTGTSEKTETELSNDEFPSPETLWAKYCQWKGITNKKAHETIQMPYYDDGTDRKPHYYQANAINKTVEAVARGQERILLVMATGTGKTYTAFQIIWRLWKSRTKQRILFLADRNILVDQTKSNDFKPFGQAMTKIAKRQIDKSYEIYLSLYQAVTGTDEEKNIYKQFSKDFFDLIVIDECHRGSAAEDSAWRDILDYFSSATHVGLTATPKETKDTSNIHYFGEPIYSYTLKQGIEDGFLAPYKVIRIDFDIDLKGWRPTKGQKDKYNNLIEDRIYNQSDIDRNIVFDERTQLVAMKITEFLQASDEFQKTIVFCDDIDHAERMRQALVNLNPQRVAENKKYVMRITGDDKLGKAELDNFINPEERYPVIATTSKLMSTGVDAQTCKLIVLDQHIKSMTEFKQIIGRGTRINEDYDKYWFTIMDFKKATELFADKKFDGDPVQIYVPKPHDPPTPPEPLEKPEGGFDPPFTDPPIEGPSTGDPPPGPWPEPVGRVKYVIKDMPVFVINERIQYYGPDGTLITETLKDYTKKTITKEFSTLDAFLKRWKQSERKAAIVTELESHGVLIEALANEVGKQYDPFDLICHVAFGQPPLTRRERAENVRKRNYFIKFGDQARKVLDALVEKYADTGIENMEDINVLTLDPFKQMGTPIELIKAFGNKQAYRKAIHELQDQLYKAS